ncbi:MAG: leucine-rich repeat domain-containing protein [Candidatus Hermodarchaeota archaeon]
MKEFLTPEKIQKRISSGELTRENAAELLISLIESSYDIDTRIQSINTLKKLNIQSEKIFKLLENYLISDENAIVRTSVAKYVIHNYLEQGFSALRWVIQHETSPLVFNLFFNYMDKFDSPHLMLIKKDLVKWNKDFSSKIGVVPAESKFFLDLEVLFAKGKKNYEINPLSYKNFETLSDNKNSEPWLLINDKHVEILNFNYFNWKFIKNNTDVINSLTKLHDLDVYLCSLKKYSYYNEISTIPESIGFLTHLNKLILRRNNLKKLPSSMKKLTQLKELDISYNKFDKIPQVLNFLNNLEKLNIKHNFIQDIPKPFNFNINVIR